jgi:hypothetical protein
MRGGILNGHWTGMNSRHKIDSIPPPPHPRLISKNLPPLLSSTQHLPPIFPVPLRHFQHSFSHTNFIFSVRGHRLRPTMESISCGQQKKPQLQSKGDTIHYSSFSPSSQFFIRRTAYPPIQPQLLPIVLYSPFSGN